MITLREADHEDVWSELEDFRRGDWALDLEQPVVAPRRGNYTAALISFIGLLTLVGGAWLLAWMSACVVRHWR